MDITKKTKDGFIKGLALGHANPGAENTENISIDVVTKATMETSPEYLDGCLEGFLVGQVIGEKEYNAIALFEDFATVRNECRFAEYLKTL